jgi:hypothetical protein
VKESGKVEDIVGDIMKRFGRLDSLIANTGYSGAMGPNNCMYTSFIFIFIGSSCKFLGVLGQKDPRVW